MTLDSPRSTGSHSPQPNASSEELSEFEAAPPLRRLHHRETVSCFQIDLSSRNKAVKKSPIELRRGAVFHANPEETKQLGGRTYLAIADCQGEPQAVGLYVRQEEAIPCPAGMASIAVRAPAKLNLRLIKRANKAGKPVMELSGVKLPEGSVLRVSSVHRVTDGDPGNGVIDADGSVDYYLVSDCFIVPAAAGLFVQIPDVTTITEDDYAKEIENFHSLPAPPLTQPCLVTPKDGAASAALFRDASQQDAKLARKLKPGELPIVKSPSDMLPAGTSVVVETAITLTGEKEYRRITECPSNPAMAGMFLLAKEVTPKPDLSSSGPQVSSESKSI